MSPSFTPTSNSLFYSRQDPLDPRLGELVKPLLASTETIKSKAWVIAGYPDDLGIEANGGRIGAREAPARIRHFLYRMTAPLQSGPPLEIWDRGDLDLNRTGGHSTTEKLAQRHAAAKSAAFEILNRKAKLLTLGGGHDYAYSDASAFLQIYGKQKPLIINFDAHLDVRPTDKGFHSGTPFRRVIDEFPHVDLVEVGIQRQCNSTDHLKWCRQKKVKTIFLDEILRDGKEGSNLWRLLKPHLKVKRPTFLSIDIDGFVSSQAPGASQSWPTGLTANGFIPVLSRLLEVVNVRGVGIYEVSPPLDVADQTSRLGAQLAYTILLGGA